MRLRRSPTPSMRSARRSRTAAAATSSSTTPAPSSAHPPRSIRWNCGTASSRSNLSSQFVLTQALARPMLERGCGKIIFTALLLSFQGGINVPGYAAAKSGIAGLTKALANEWAARGVTVNAIAPGLHRDRQHPGTARRPRPVDGDPGADPGRAMGRGRRPRGRHGLPRVARLGLRVGRRAAGRRRLARPMMTACLDDDRDQRDRHRSGRRHRRSRPGRRIWRTRSSTEESAAQRSPCAPPARSPRSARRLRCPAS